MINMDNIDHCDRREEFISCVKKGLIPLPQTLLYPLSNEQERMWFAIKAGHGGEAYNLCSAFVVTDEIDVIAFQHALDQITNRHEILRTVFVEQDGLPKQRIQSLKEAAGINLCIKECDVSEQEEQTKKILVSERKYAYDLSLGPLVRFTVVKTTGQSSSLIVNMHHIIADDWSISNFLAELIPLYFYNKSGSGNHSAPNTGEDSVIPYLKAQYKDFCLWQENWLDSDHAKSQLSYWKYQLAEIKPLSLRSSMPRPINKSLEGGSVDIEIEADDLTKLKEIAKNQNTTLFVMLTTIFALSLINESQQDDFAIGTSVSTRKFPCLEPLVGLFLNQITLRVDATLNPDLATFLSRMRMNVINGMNNADLPFGVVVSELVKERDSSRSPIFDVLLTLQNAPTDVGISNIPVKTLEYNIDFAKYDLSWFFSEKNNKLHGKLVFNSKLFTNALLTRFSSEFIFLSKSIEKYLYFPINKILNEIKRYEEMELVSKPQKPKFERRERKVINLNEINLVRESKLTDRGPHLIEPALADVNFGVWLKDNKDEVERKLLSSGALLFRGFGHDELSSFERTLNTLCSTVIEDYGDLPEEKGSRQVYGSTPYPENKTILFHSESSHLSTWPLKQFFSCVQPSVEGGETPIVDTRRIYNKIDPAIIKRFAKLNLNYVRHFIPGLDVSWQSFYKTDSKQQVNEMCKLANTKCTWYEDTVLATAKISQAVAIHPFTAEPVFFNQIMLHHPYFLSATEREALNTLYGENRLPRNVTFGNGTEIETSILEEIMGIYEQESIKFPWQKGDLLVVDNMLIAHGRLPYKGKRKIIVGMGDPFSMQKLATIE